MNQFKHGMTLKQSEVIDNAFNLERRYIDIAYLQNSKPMKSSQLFSSFPKILMADSVQKKKKTATTTSSPYSMMLTAHGYPKKSSERKFLTETELDEVNNISNKLTKFNLVKQIKVKHKALKHNQNLVTGLIPLIKYKKF
ncbi:hypothetical protein SS50377_26384 [Spironucleus salmonicida]|uniref:Uncharacterized protein n=1 Tax=Spironucleus salmonicida TaxID=348837 RepID=V6M3A0_9EUKA|nr:hypothetical protein SS50377_26384 [Spironucleus salmonicida]|eukprot:EST47749.1 Hypothetical protein SS50377_12148 [Spironucleus salmonicida]